jgi:serine/threonine protein kinase
MAIPLAHLEGKYEILGKMTEGGMGSVYKVRHRLLDEIRVIKVMRPGLASDDVFKARFVREAKVAIKLRHPNLAQIYDFTMDDEGAAFIVMEFIDGFPLQRLRSLVQRPSLGLIREIGSQALDVLAYLHRKKVVHRDISPDNLLLTRDEDLRPHLKLIDLGIAKETEGDQKLTTQGVFLGKVRYSSPEHFKDQEGVEVDQRSDLYSLAVVLCELLTGQLPIRGRSVSSLIAGHLMEPPIPFEETDPEGGVPLELQEVLLKAMAKSPDSRHPTAQDFLHALRAAIPATEPDEVELRRLFEAPVDATIELQVIKPGSTQSHLDRHFRLESTPGPDTASGIEEVLAGGADKAVTSSATAPTTQQIAVLLRGADKLVEAQHLEEARSQVRAVLELDPAHAEARKLAATIDSLDTRLQQRRKTAAEAVLQLVQDERFDEARTQLTAARDRHGDCEAFDQASEALESSAAAARDRDERVAAMLESAHHLVFSNELEDALAMLREVLMVSPVHHEATKLQREVETAHALQVAESRRQQEIDDGAAAVQRHVDAGDLVEAERALRLARKVYGDQEPFAEVATNLAAAERADRRRRAADLAATAETHLAKGEWGHAMELVQQARTLDSEAPDLDRIESEAAEKQRYEEEARVRQQQIDEATARVERLLGAGRWETAYRTLDATVEQFGSFSNAETLRQRIEHEVAARRELEAHAWSLVERARRHAEAAEFSEAHALLTQVRALEDEVPEVHELVVETEDEIRRRLEEHRRATAIAEAVDSIDQRLAADDLERAEHQLAVAERLFGRDPGLRDVRDRVANLRRTRCEAEAERVIQDALSGKRDFDEVMATLESALEADPGHETLQRLVAETRATWHRLQQERRSQRIATVMAEVDDLVAEGDLKAAVARLDQAINELGSFREATAVRHRLLRAGR